MVRAVAFETFLEIRDARIRSVEEGQNGSALERWVRFDTEEIERFLGLVERLPELTAEQVRQLNIVVPSADILAGDEERVGVL